MLTVVKEWKGGQYKYCEGSYQIDITCDVNADGSFKSLNGSIIKDGTHIASINSESGERTERGFVVNVNGLTLDNRTEVNAIVDSCLNALKTKLGVKTE